MFEIKDLEVTSIDQKKIINGLNIKIKKGEIHVIMGPNGAGKSTICKSILHHPSYVIKKGSIIYQEKDITHFNTSDIAKLGIYYMNQTPIEVEGITNAEVIRTSLIDKGISNDIFSFNKKCNFVCEKLKLPKSFLHRNVNDGMSGGERKKTELFGMWMLEPSFIILDEIDSGLDVDALKLVGNNIREYHEMTNASVLIITHQQKLIDALNPDFIHIMREGKIVDTGNISLAKEIEKNGFSKYSGANDVSGKNENE